MLFRSFTPSSGQENEAAPSTGKQYDVTQTGAKVITRTNSRKGSASDSPFPALTENSDNDYCDDIDFTSFDHLTSLISQVAILKTERLRRDDLDDKAEKKYNLAKRLFQSGTLSKKAFDFKAKEWELSLKTGISAHNVRKVKLVNLEVRTTRLYLLLHHRYICLVKLFGQNFP